jgi:ATP-binding cassette, subfamily B, bacterial MsbA
LPSTATPTTAAAPMNSAALYGRLLKYLVPYRGVFLLGIFGMVLAALTEPLFPAIMKKLLDDGFGAKNRNVIMWLPIALIGIFILRGLITFCTSYCIAWVSNKILTDIREQMFGRLVRLPTRFYDDQASGLLISRIAYDVGNVTAAATSVITVLVRDTVIILGLLAYLFYENWKLTLIALIVIPSSAVVIRLFSKRLRNMSRAAQAAVGSITQVLGESIEAHKVVKVYGGQGYEASRFGRANHMLRGINMRQTIAAAATVPITQFFAAIALAAVIYAAMWQSQADQTSVGSFVAFITAMLMLLAPLKHLADVNAPLQRGLAAAESVFAMLDEPMEEDRGIHTLGRSKGALRFEQVVFKHERAERAALDGVSIDITPGQTVALVGPSGGGKTTFANLIPRFYRPTSGRISLDGIDINEIKLESLRENLAFVSQDVVLFNDTVAANIAYGLKQSVSREAIEAAARAAFADHFIAELPQGYDTLIGENGVRLSGGQRQRLAIARALLKDAPLLILDEATSALDTESERQVQAALEVLMKDRTTLVIAHRLSTIEKANVIAVLERGRIVERGTHAALLEQGGVYSHLYRLQFAEAAQ